MAVVGTNSGPKHFSPIRKTTFDTIQLFIRFYTHTIYLMTTYNIWTLFFTLMPMLPPPPYKEKCRLLPPYISLPIYPINLFARFYPIHLLQILPHTPFWQILPLTPFWQILPHTLFWGYFTPIKSSNIQFENFTPYKKFHILGDPSYLKFKFPHHPNIVVNGISLNDLMTKKHTCCAKPIIIYSCLLCSGTTMI